MHVQPVLIQNAPAARRSLRRSNHRGVLGLHSLTEFNVNIKTYVLIYMKRLSYIILHSFDHAETEVQVVSNPIPRNDWSQQCAQIQSPSVPVKTSLLRPREGPDTHTQHPMML